MSLSADNPLCILNAAQAGCLTNAFVLGYLIAKMDKNWEVYHGELEQMTWELEIAWNAACTELATNTNDHGANPGPFVEFAREWFIARLVAERIES